ncbi:MAG: UDP-N-acetylenolpyruvoylglucosamine reductase [Eubacteriales bacterium SKADARSKE-1]|nr:UDP-N-acetylenolpyruvoylglucosamine reductase [Eubacteriales bacterium SKADARSKE-1]
MYNYKKALNLFEKLDCIVLKDEPMSNHTSFKIGGPADLFIEINTEAALLETIKILNEFSILFFLLGNGSNLLVRDVGFKGAVLKLSKNFKNIRLTERKKIICGAGISLSKLCLFAENNALSGAEFLWGIPGTVGGAVFMNAGAYGREIKDIIVSSVHITKQGEKVELNKNQMDLSYRHSIYSKTKDIITSVEFELVESNQLHIREIMDNLIKQRKSKQPLDYPSAGSVFKRPSGNFVGTLIEECGLKGKTIGDAKVSEKHGGFIVNLGNATCQNVLDLIELIKSTVFEKTGILLEPEIKVL